MVYKLKNIKQRVVDNLSYIVGIIDEETVARTHFGGFNAGDDDDKVWKPQRCFNIIFHA